MSKIEVQGKVALSSSTERAVQGETKNIYSEPVKNASVIFVSDSGKKTTTPVSTNADGEFKIELWKGESGYLVCNKNGEGQLESRIDPSKTNTGDTMTKNITPATTLTSSLIKTEGLGKIGIDDIEEYVDLELGYSKELSQEFEDSFKENRKADVDKEKLAKTALAISDSNEAIMKNCSDSQAWCIIVSQIQARKENAEGVAQIILKRIHKVFGNEGYGSVGSGLVEIQWPSPMVYSSVVLDKAISASDIRYSINGKSNNGTTILAFYYVPKDGLVKSTRLFEIGLLGRVATGPNALRPALVRHQLRGALIEKRSLAKVQ